MMACRLASAVANVICTSTRAALLKEMTEKRVDSSSISMHRISARLAITRRFSSFIEPLISTMNATSLPAGLATTASPVSQVTDTIASRRFTPKPRCGLKNVSSLNAIFFLHGGNPPSFVRTGGPRRRGLPLRLSHLQILAPIHTRREACAPLALFSRLTVAARQQAGVAHAVGVLFESLHQLHAHLRKLLVSLFALAAIVFVLRQRGVHRLQHLVRGARQGLDVAQPVALRGLGRRVDGAERVRVELADVAAQLAAGFRVSQRLADVVERAETQDRALDARHVIQNRVDDVVRRDVARLLD